MCVVSAVTGYYQKAHPIVNNQFHDNWNFNNWAQLNEALEILRRLDAAMGEPDCIDPDKDKWLKEMSELYDRANRPTEG